VIRKALDEPQFAIFLAQSQKSEEVARQPLMAKSIARRIDAGTLHAHIGEEPLRRYRMLFEHISRMDRGERIYHESDDRIIALPHVEVDRNHVFLTAYEGDLGVNPLIFNTANSSERLEHLGQAEVVATRTHAVIDLRTRRAVVEYNQKGAKSSHIAIILQQLSGIDGLSVHFTPIVQQSFLEQMEQFRRVRVARVQLMRPNSSWNDAEDRLLGIAQDSSAQRVELLIR
jgi:hypothetical protein